MNSNSLLVEMQNGTITLDNSLLVSYKTKHIFYQVILNCAPWYLTKGVENLSPHKNLHVVVVSFIHNCHNLEETKMSFSR